MLYGAVIPIKDTTLQQDCPSFTYYLW